MEKFDIFLEVAGELNRSFAITPILYGSLGLRTLLKKRMTVNDVDILVPQKFVNNKWKDLKDSMEKLKFELKDLKEHEFIRNGEIVAFASDKTLGDIDLVSKDLNETVVRGVIFKELSAKQYLKVYKFTLHDGYRLTKHSDEEKISLLEKFLSNKFEPERF
ncbi:MAG: hypothetical protein HY435_00715 [Candidatus Liptonbacteria bacterium]|nr:hypothetical protein [Candidatus Liptonbacteria bacterium]